MLQSVPFAVVDTEAASVILVRAPDVEFSLPIDQLPLEMRETIGARLVEGVATPAPADGVLERPIQAPAEGVVRFVVDDALTNRSIELQAGKISVPRVALLLSPVFTLEAAFGGGGMRWWSLAAIAVFSVLGTLRIPVFVPSWKHHFRI